MNLSKKWIVLGFLYGTAIFVLSPSFKNMINNPVFWNIKEQLLYLTGAIAMTYMVISMLISIRIDSVSKYLGGLDKAYVVHKWVGIMAFAFMVLHWVVKEGPKLLGMLITLPPKIKSTSSKPYSAFQESIFDFGNEMVEIVFYIFVVVLVISLLKKMPYHIFRLIHKSIAVMFLIAAYHAATIQIKGQWFGSIGSVLLMIILGAGIAAALISLLQVIGKSHKSKTVIKKIGYYKDAGVIDIRLSLADGSFNYKAGQYAFLQFGFSGEPHPFSITSYDANKKEIRFLIKELGDFTKKLYGNIKEGDTVTLEGPYGEFTFDDKEQHQVWIAGGIGLAPFVSRLEYLAVNKDKSKSIDFFYSSRGESVLKPMLTELCQKAGVNFHYTDTSKDGRLCIEKIKDKAKNITDASFWYCGPALFCNSLKRTLCEKKLHYDNFDMR